MIGSVLEKKFYSCMSGRSQNLKINSFIKPKQLF